MVPRGVRNLYLPTRGDFPSATSKWLHARTFSWPPTTRHHHTAARPKQPFHLREDASPILGSRPCRTSGTRAHHFEQASGPWGDTTSEGGIDGPESRGKPGRSALRPRHRGRRPGILPADELISDANGDVLAVRASPPPPTHFRTIWSTARLERLTEESTRRAGAVRIFRRRNLSRTISLRSAGRCGLVDQTTKGPLQSLPLGRSMAGLARSATLRTPSSR
jgi:hypothetical protein